LYAWLPSIWVLFGIILWEGLLGGATYVNCYYQITHRTAPEHREFSLGAVGVADSLGITAAGALSLFLEGALCRWQIDHGRPLCSTV
ncbi:batten's disease protein Cln3, partial [Thamnocephalis sphaerospora]